MVLFSDIFITSLLTMQLIRSTHLPCITLFSRAISRSFRRFLLTSFNLFVRTRICSVSSAARHYNFVSLFGLCSLSCFLYLSCCLTLIFRQFSSALSRSLSRGGISYSILACFLVSSSLSLSLLSLKNSA